MHATPKTILILFLILLYNDVLLGEYDGPPPDFTTTCTCSRNSSSKYYCSEWSCLSVSDKVSCFSGQSTVHTRDGRHISLSNVQIDEKVLTFDGNKLIFEPIYDFIHAEKIGFYDFLRLTIFNNHRNSTSNIEISSQHLIFLHGKCDPIFASEVQIGHHLQLVDEDRIIPGEVIKVEHTLSQGFSAPLTRSGTIVVNGVIASNYAEARNHRLAHLVMQPYRLWRMIVGAKRSIDSDMNWYIDMLYFFADKTGLLLFL